MKTVKDIHPPKTISSNSNLGLPTNDREIQWEDDEVMMAVEDWSQVDSPWSESGTVIGDQGYQWVTRWRVGQPYIISKFYDQQGELVGTYCDIGSDIVEQEGELQMQDWYLDVWRPAGEEAIVLDQDELRAAVRLGYLTPQQAVRAHQIAQELLEMLESGDLAFEF